MADLLTELKNQGLTLPKAPPPVAAYVPAGSIHSGSMVFISGQLPFRDGLLMATGLVGKDVSIEDAQRCAKRGFLGQRRRRARRWRRTRRRRRSS